MSEAVFARVTQIARETRAALTREKRRPYDQVAAAYRDYLVATGQSIAVGPHEVVADVLRHFPRGCDLVASCYLHQRIQQDGGADWPDVWHHGGYENKQQVYVLLGELAIADITADQHGGPEVYVGPLAQPWRLWRDLA